MDATREALLEFGTNSKFSCEERGSVANSSVSIVFIVSCRGDDILGLGRVLLENNAAVPICSETSGMHKECGR